ncbi:hypothetical protein [Photorhabdus luminescens]|uniref:Uncharacterized protein n=1 Tax=Photorhabdus luminescens subsp. mexicana TaxID=2100167 RepID=A0A4R4IWL5_PHOLU|nr:hypothetical protein [Photorhabdus luminescens]TDB45327.1 hypothetical protein C5468_21355 [Photorhabdus luminescens subsp. mexicana]
MVSQAANTQAKIGFANRAKTPVTDRFIAMLKTTETALSDTTSNKPVVSIGKLSVQSVRCLSSEADNITAQASNYVRGWPCQGMQPQAMPVKP